MQTLIVIKMKASTVVWAGGRRASYLFPDLKCDKGGGCRQKREDDRLDEKEKRAIGDRLGSSRGPAAAPERISVFDTGLCVSLALWLQFLYPRKMCLFLDPRSVDRLSSCGRC